MKNSNKGFTLIELLIVVAIIAILAAIAIPNFLAAQVRAKVSRAKSELKTLQTAVESYYVDENSYPIYSATNFYNLGLVRLTTPIPYIASVPLDPFKFRGTWYGGNGAAGWYWGYTNASGTPAPQPNAYIMWSNGPDIYNQLPGFMTRADIEADKDCRAVLQQPTWWGFIGGSYTYDPSNGTVSYGDIWVVSK
jgi:prepilin-type N-terminal cleavage/methylation domain-containing protein